MADRIVSPSRFHAEGAGVPWPVLAKLQLASTEDSRLPKEVVAERDELLRRLAKERPGEVHLRWACSTVLGAPPRPFTVWTRRRRTPRRSQVVVTATPQPDHQRIHWDGRRAAVLEVVARPHDPQRPMALIGFRGPASPTTVVGVTRITASGTKASLVLRSTGVTEAALVNGSFVSGSIDRLRDVVRDDDWEELEIVGLPAPEGRVAGYEDREQGLVAAPTDPEEAAAQRVRRGGPPIGWWPVTATGKLAPPWAPADPDAVVAEVVHELLPVVGRLYDHPSPAHGGLTLDVPMDQPEQDGRATGEPQDATLPPFGALLLAATTDPFLALATGFGTAYAAGDRDRQLQGRDFLITADYDDTPEGGPATYAAFVPWPDPHQALAAVSDLTSGRDGLVEPAERDAPWRETVRLRWRHREATAALGRPTGAAAARAEPAGAAAAESLLSPREAGGWRTLVPVAEPPAPGRTASDHDRFVDVARTIALGSGGRSAAYAVAVHDVYGVWSRWEDVGYAGAEPAAPLPRVMRVAIDSRYEDSPVCPSRLEVELALDWRQRTPRDVEVVALVYPATSSETAPPPDAGPTGAIPLGCQRQTVHVPFVGDEATSAEAKVTHLDAEGEFAPPGPAQSDDSRRYRLTWEGPPVDHGAHPWFGVVVWARLRSEVLPAPSAWAPVPPASGAEGRAYAHTASPVPPPAPSPPPLPGVPIGSTPDAAGRSHVRVRWPAAASPPERFHVWELTEGAVRSLVEAAGGVDPPTSDVPAARLSWLRERLAAGIDGSAGLPAWRGRFSLVAEVPGTRTSVDVPLERGSQDIHLFVVTAESATGIRSPWPTSEESVQAFAAPRVRAPAAPALRTSFGGDATNPTLELSVDVASDVPVEEVALFRTRSEVAARSAETMGPPFATVSAAATGETTDAGEAVYAATWSGPVPTGWRPTRFRAVARPVPEVPAEALVGNPSAGSPVVTVDVPPADGPTLEPLVADTFADTGIVVRTATDAPPWPVTAGPFTVEVLATDDDGHEVAAPVAATLAGLAEDDLDVPPGPIGAGTDVAPELRRGPRDGGSTPFGVWLRRPTFGTAVQIRVRVVDPLGRVAERTVHVPGGTVGTPPSLDVVDRWSIAGRGLVIVFRSDATLRRWRDRVSRLQVRARTVPERPVRPVRPITPPVIRDPRPELPDLPPRPGVPGLPGRLDVARRWHTFAVDLPDVPRVDPSEPRPHRGTIGVVRTSDRSPYDYQVFVRLTGDVEVVVTVTGPTGLATERHLRPGR